MQRAEKKKILNQTNLQTPQLLFGLKTDLTAEISHTKTPSKPYYLWNIKVNYIQAINIANLFHTRRGK